MKITIEHHGEQFNVALVSAQGKEAFLTIKGCRLKESANGRFISFPARKMDNGKWWNHVYASEGFQAAIMAELDNGAPPARDTRTHSDRKRGEPPANSKPGNWDDSDIPF